jgi:hypothetical protein
VAAGITACGLADALTGVPLVARKVPKLRSSRVLCYSSTAGPGSLAPPRPALACKGRATARRQRTMCQPIKPAQRAAEAGAGAARGPCEAAGTPSPHSRSYRQLAPSITAPCAPVARLAFVADGLQGVGWEALEAQALARLVPVFRVLCVPTRAQPTHMETHGFQAEPYEVSHSVHLVGIRPRAGRGGVRGRSGDKPNPSRTFPALASLAAGARALPRLQPVLCFESAPLGHGG